MKLPQLAAQLYTVRDFCKTAAGLAATAKKIREIGYPAVQVSGIGPIPDDEVVRIMAGEGLTICATHEPSQSILDTPEQALERVQRLGCTQTAYPYPGGIDFTNAAVIESFCEKLDRAGAIFRKAGVTLSYHNHAIEFMPFRGATVLDYIFAHTARRNLTAELDTYWVQFGGGDPVAWCAKLAGRLSVLHLKDYGFTTENKPVFAEIGRGNLDFARIIAAAENSGCRWFVVEQDTCPGDPFDSLRLSFEYIRQNLLEN
ncbi:MAG: sugar phosphate isomerase/epimerase [Opitutaceae bacterium]|nr:sugar phosphate isomerase/epimerase [Opitutaceae bacterium]